MCVKRNCPAPDIRSVEDGELVNGVVRRMEARAAAHETFALWKQFPLHDYP